MKEILAITGKPGLFKIVSRGGKTLIVEDITNGRRFPLSQRDRVVSLGDIAMYTESEDKPLSEILESISLKENKKTLNVKEIINNEGLKERFSKYLPDFDRERVHDSDIKKLFTWYDLLISNGITDFTDKSEEKSQSEEAETPSKEEEAKEGNPSK